MSYLVPVSSTNATLVSEASSRRTFLRLLETLQWVLDVMGGTSDNGDMTPLKGEGWRSTIRVRMLHGIARRRILMKMRANKSCPVAGQKTEATGTAGCPIFASGVPSGGFETLEGDIDQSQKVRTGLNFFFEQVSQLTKKNSPRPCPHFPSLRSGVSNASGTEQRLNSGTIILHFGDMLVSTWESERT